MKGFINFIREQGVVGLAIGFILGGAVSTLVKSFVEDIINPIINPLLGAAGNINTATLTLGPVKLQLGNFTSNLINFIIIALVVYYGFKGMRLDKIDKKKG
jgi:large conductance mechanosensitive channel